MRKKEVFLTLDIGTEAVKALIFSDSFTGKKILILGAGTAYFKGNKIKEAILEAIERARSNSSFSLVKSELKKKIEKKKEWSVLIGLSSNILKARIVSRVFLRERPEKKISGKEQNFIIRQVLESAKKGISKEFGILTPDIEWLCLKIVSVRIDGYPVLAPRGYSGKRMEFKIMVTFIGKNYSERIKKVLSPLNLKITKIVHIAQGLAAIDKEDGLFIDIGGEVTQIFEVKNNQIEHIAEFKKGARDFIEDLSQRLAIDIDTARSLEENYSKGVLSPGSLKKIKEIFSWERKIWYGLLKEKLKNSNPSNIFLLGGGSFLSDISDILKEKPIFSAAPNVDFIYLEDLKAIVNTTKGLDSPQYIPSLLLTLANV